MDALAIATVALAIATFLLAIFSFCQIWQTKRNNKRRLHPYVAIMGPYLEYSLVDPANAGARYGPKPSEVHEWFPSQHGATPPGLDFYPTIAPRGGLEEESSILGFCLTNSGLGPALKVTLRILDMDPEMTFLTKRIDLLPAISPCSQPVKVRKTVRESDLLSSPVGERITGKSSRSLSMRDLKNLAKGYYLEYQDADNDWYYTLVISKRTGLSEPTESEQSESRSHQVCYGKGRLSLSSWYKQTKMLAPTAHTD